MILCDVVMLMKNKLKRTVREIVQVRNPKTNRYIKIDRAIGMVLSHKKSHGPYKNIPVLVNESAKIHKYSDKVISQINC